MINHKIIRMKTKIVLRGDWAMMIHLLQKNVGKLLHSQPTVMWHGDGWHMTSVRNHDGWPAFKIEFDKEEDATIFMLKW